MTHIRLILYVFLNILSLTVKNEVMRKKENNSDLKDKNHKSSWATTTNSRQNKLMSGAIK